MKKIKKVIKYLAISLFTIAIILFIGLYIYSLNSYQPEKDMFDEIDQLDLIHVTINESNRSIKYTIDNPIKNIIILPGGLVEPQSYQYLASKLALSGYQVTIVKPYFNLAILTPNQAKKYLSEELENVIIGHSLGGVVGNIIASNDDRVDSLILLGSYLYQPIEDVNVLLIRASNDTVLDEQTYIDSLSLAEGEVEYMITGGNHAQFGWYGLQKGDGTATISTLDQQESVITRVLAFIQ